MHISHAHSDTLSGTRNNPSLLVQRQQQLAQQRERHARRGRSRWARFGRYSPPGEANPRPRRITLWLHALREHPTGEATGEPAWWFRLVRSWSPAIVPPTAGTLTILFIALVSSAFSRSVSTIVDPQMIIPLILVYLAFTTAYGVVLYISPTTVVWMRALILGLIIYLVSAVWLLSQWTGIMLIAIPLLFVAFRHLRSHLVRIERNAIAVTVFAGGYHRTLGRGIALLLPGEHVRSRMSLQETTLSCPPQRVTIHAFDGTPYLAQAEVSIGYRVVPAQAHLASLAAGDWEARLLDRTIAALRESLTNWGQQLVSGTERLQDQQLARSLLALMRQENSRLGIHVKSAKVHNIWLVQAAEADKLPPLAPDPVLVPATVPLGDEAQTTSVHAQAQDSGEATALSETDQLNALADLYEAVRSGTIQDPTTIRSIAQAFVSVASNDHMRAGLDFDPADTAARLQEFATALEQRSVGGHMTSRAQ